MTKSFTFFYTNLISQFLPLILLAFFASALETCQLFRTDAEISKFPTKFVKLNCEMNNFLESEPFTTAKENEIVNEKCN
jgi:hypothetical protein